MEFSMREWRQMYDSVHKMGKLLNSARPTYDEDGNYYPPKIKMLKSAQKGLERDIQVTTQRCSYYLDKCSLMIREPLWRYDYNDETTHPSSTKFKFGHLLTLRG